MHIEQRAAGALPRLLPLVHVTSWRRAEAILQSGVLEARPCKVFTTSLGLAAHVLYFFYGKAAYQPEDRVPELEMALAPVAFVLDPAAVTAAPSRVYPFDTGALMNGLYDRFMRLSGGSPVPYEIGNDIGSAQRLVRAFYESNENYMLRQVRALIDDVPVEWFETRKYLGLISFDGAENFDDRASTIEVQFDSDVALRPALRSIVVPAQLARAGTDALALINRHIVDDANIFRYHMKRGSVGNLYGAMSERAIDAVKNFI